MNKDEILRQLQSIINEITCTTNNEKLDETPQSFTEKYDRHMWNEPSIIRTQIIMEKRPVKE